MLAPQEEKRFTPTNKDDIEFPNSPYYKPIKKYLRWRFENSYTNVSDNLPPSTSPEVNFEKVEKDSSTSAMLQPPLPPYSPPPGCPIDIKQEIDVKDFYSTHDAPGAVSNINQPEIRISDVNQGNKPSPQEIMCRNFVRGTCKKGPACKFVHRIIREQLKNVYIFCKSFQNEGCSLPRCKFVHCSIFEQANFYRTGELPQYDTDDFKQRHQPKGHKLAVPGCSMTNMVHFVNGDRPVVYQFGGTPDYTISSCKQQRTETSEVSYLQHGVDISVPPRKKCKDCETNEFRYLFYENKMKEMELAAGDHVQKIDELNKKTQCSRTYESTESLKTEENNPSEIQRLNI